MYGCVHLLWETVADESTLIFYEREREIYNVTVADDSYRLTVDAEWLKGVSDKTDLRVEVKAMFDTSVIYHMFRDVQSGNTHSRYGASWQSS